MSDPAASSSFTVKMRQSFNIEMPSDGGESPLPPCTSWSDRIVTFPRNNPYALLLLGVGNLIFATQQVVSIWQGGEDHSPTIYSRLLAWMLHEATPLIIGILLIVCGLHYHEPELYDRALARVFLARFTLFVAFFVVAFMVFLYYYYFRPIIDSINVYRGSKVVAGCYTVLFFTVHSMVVLILIDLMAGLLGCRILFRRYIAMIEVTTQEDAGVIYEAYVKLHESLDREITPKWTPLYSTFTLIYLLEIFLRGISIVVVHSGGYSRYTYVGGLIFLGLALLSSALLFYPIALINGGSFEILTTASWNNCGCLMIGSLTRHDILHLFRSQPYEVMIGFSGFNMRLSNDNLTLFYRGVVLVYVSVLIRLAVEVN
jgi:hypothetical protein